MAEARGKRSAGRRTAGCLLAGVVLALAAPALGGNAGMPANGPVVYNGKSYYLNGINVPWNKFGWDFGNHYQWGNGYDAASAAWFENCFTDCQAYGVNCVRIWVHCDGRASPEFDGAGNVTGLDASFLSDLEDVLRRADDHGILVILCLWSFDMCDDYTATSGQYAGMHADLITDTAKTQTYVNKALIPMVQRFANTPNLLAWEIMNEPEWAVTGIGPGTPSTAQAVTSAEMQRFVGTIAAAIHQNSAKMATVGSACLRWSSTYAPLAFGNLWTDAALLAASGYAQSNLDFYQVHYYDWMYEVLPATLGYDPFDLLPAASTPSLWVLDKPCIVGECQGKAGAYTIQQIAENCYANGWSGLLFWNYRNTLGAPDDDLQGYWTDVRDRIKAIRDAHPTLVNLPPRADSITPNNCGRSGGSALTISGAYFASGVTVTIGGAAATSVTRVDSRTITCRAPAHAEGSANVVVANPDTQSSTLAAGFWFWPVATLAATVAEIAENATGAAVFTLTLSAAVPAPVTVNYAVGGTATGGEDYTALSGSATIPAGSTSTTILVQPVDDYDSEDDETVTVNLAAGTSYTVSSPSSDRVTILEDDPSPGSGEVIPAAYKGRISIVAGNPARDRLVAGLDVSGMVLPFTADPDDDKDLFTGSLLIGPKKTAREFGFEMDGRGRSRSKNYIRIRINPKTGSATVKIALTDLRKALGISLDEDVSDGILEVPVTLTIGGSSGRGTLLFLLSVKANTKAEARY